MAKKRSFIEIYDWEEINFTSEAKDWESFEKTTNQSLSTCSSQYTIKKNKQKSVHFKMQFRVFKSKRHYFAITSLSILLRQITSKNNGAYCCANIIHSFRTANRLKLHEDIYKDHDYCHVKMSEVHSNILKFNNDQNL